MKVIVVSGGFDPIHSGHIDYLRSAKNYGHKLIVALNSDSWLIKKKGKFLMPFEERKIVIESITYVDEVLGFNDDERVMYNALIKLNHLIKVKRFILLMVVIEINRYLK